MRRIKIFKFHKFLYFRLIFLVYLGDVIALQ